MSVLPGFVAGAAAIPHIPGDPAQLRAAAAQFGAAAQWLGALSHEVAGTQGALAGSWSGLAAMMAESACEQVSQPVHQAQAAYLDTAGALTRFAEALETAQREADAARGAADEASHAAFRALAQAGEVEADPHADPALVARAQGRVTAAEGQAGEAVAQGQAAYDRAQQAARVAGKTFSAIAGQAPQPPPPPPPPPKPDEGHHGALGFLEHWGAKAVGGLLGPAGLVGQGVDQATGGHGPRWIPGTQAFNQDVVVGAGDTVVGTAQGGWTLFKAGSPLYGTIDQPGQQHARDQLAQGVTYSAHHPWQAGKQILGIDYLEHGQPGKFYGQAGVTALAAIATDGGGAVTKVASGAAKLTRRVGVAYRVSRSTHVDDLRELGKFDYSQRLGGELRNFAEPSPRVQAVVRGHDQFFVNFGDSSKRVGTRRSVAY